MLLLLKHFSSPLWICGEFLDFNGTTDLPLGIIVNKYIVFHCQFEVWNLFTHPPEENIKSSRATHDTLTRCACGSWVREPLLTEWSRWFHEQHRGVYPENREGHTFPKTTKVRMLNSTFTRWQRQKIINYVIEESHLKKINISWKSPPETWKCVPAVNHNCHHFNTTILSCQT